MLTRSIRDSEISIDFVQGPPGSRRERVKSHLQKKVCGDFQSLRVSATTFKPYSLYSIMLDHKLKGTGQECRRVECKSAKL